MDRSEILNRLEHFKTRYQETYRFRRIGIFGSVARQTGSENSDLDVLVEQIEPDLFLLGAIKADLEKEFGVKVDVIRLHKGMNTFLSKRISQEAVYV